jgi:hypothetical protein
MEHKITKKFSDEVRKQIYQFGIDLIEDISNEIDLELEKQKPVLGLTREQSSAFSAVLQAARQRVLARYDLETKDSRTDEPYPGETYPANKRVKKPKAA